MFRYKQIDMNVEMSEQREIWEQHKETISSIPHKTYRIISKKELAKYIRLSDILLIKKVKKSFYCSKERLEALQYEKSYFKLASGKTSYFS